MTSIKPFPGSPGHGGTGTVGRTRSSSFSIGFKESLNYNSISLLDNLSSQRHGKILDEDEFNNRYKDRNMNFVAGNTDEDYEDILIRRQIEANSDISGFGQWVGYIGGSIAAEVLEPLNYIGLGAIYKGAKLATKIKRGAVAATIPEVIKAPAYYEYEKKLQADNPWGFVGLTMGASAGFGGILGAAGHAVKSYIRNSAKKVIQQETNPSANKTPDDTLSTKEYVHQTVYPDRPTSESGLFRDIDGLSHSDVKFVNNTINRYPNESPIDKMVVIARTRPIQAMQFLAKEYEEFRKLIDDLVPTGNIEQKINIVRNTLRNTDPDQLSYTHLDKKGFPSHQGQLSGKDNIPVPEQKIPGIPREEWNKWASDPEHASGQWRKDLRDDRITAFYSMIDIDDLQAQKIIDNIIDTNGPLDALNKIRRNVSFVDVALNHPEIIKFLDNILPEYKDFTNRANIFKKILNEADGDLIRANEILNKLKFDNAKEFGITPHDVLKNAISSTEKLKVKFVDGDTVEGTADEIITEAKLKDAETDAEIKAEIDKSNEEIIDIEYREKLQEVEAANKQLHEAIDSYAVCKLF